MRTRDAEIRRLHAEGLSADEIAARVGVHRTTVGKSLRRDGMITIARAHLVAFGLRLFGDHLARDHAERGPALGLPARRLGMSDLSNQLRDLAAHAKHDPADLTPSEIQDLARMAQQRLERWEALSFYRSLEVAPLLDGTGDERVTLSVVLPREEAQDLLCLRIGLEDQC